MIECLATAWLNECYSEGRVFVSYSSDAQADCGDHYTIVAPEADDVERAACGLKLGERFTVEVVDRIEPNDVLAAVNVARSRMHRDALASYLEGWMPGEGYGLVRMVGGGFSGVSNNHARWRYQFAVELTCSPRISNELQQKWDGMVSDE